MLGGGPAGLVSAARIALLGRRVALFDRDVKPEHRVGETLSPQVRHLLQFAGLGDGLEEVFGVPFVGTRSFWGSSEPYEHSQILNPLGEGAHVDRGAFDSWLKSAAAGAGVRIEQCSTPPEIRFENKAWTVSGVTARYLLDARGRASPGPLPERNWIALDRLVGIVGWLRPTKPRGKTRDDADSQLLIETVPEGWWYSAPQPDGRLVATLMTDADLIESSGRESLQKFWAKSLEKAEQTAERLIPFALYRELTVRRAESGFSFPDRGTQWQAIGDAAMAWDPLAGSGIANAIRSGLDAAAEVNACLDGASPALSEVEAKLALYLEERAKYYGYERRWPDSVFWARRQPIGLDRLPLAVHPEDTLASGKEISRLEMARVEALLPPRAIRDFLALLKTPMVAHAALTEFRKITGPIGDMRILVGVQLLVEFGAVVVRWQAD